MNETLLKVNLVEYRYMYGKLYCTVMFLLRALWFSWVTIHSYDNIQLTVSGLCDHSGYLYGLTFVHVHT